MRLSKWSGVKLSSCAVLNVKLNYLDGWIGQRQEKAKRYVGLFQQSGSQQQAVVGAMQKFYEKGNF